MRNEWWISAVGLMSAALTVVAGCSSAANEDAVGEDSAESVKAQQQNVSCVEATTAQAEEAYTVMLGGTITFDTVYTDPATSTVYPIALTIRGIGADSSGIAPEPVHIIGTPGDCVEGNLTKAVVTATCQGTAPPSTKGSGGKATANLAGLGNGGGAQVLGCPNGVADLTDAVRAHSALLANTGAQIFGSFDPIGPDTVSLAATTLVDPVGPKHAITLQCCSAGPLCNFNNGACTNGGGGGGH